MAAGARGVTLDVGSVASRGRRDVSRELRHTLKVPRRARRAVLWLRQVPALAQGGTVDVYLAPRAGGEPIHAGTLFLLGDGSGALGDWAVDISDAVKALAPAGGEVDVILRADDNAFHVGRLQLDLT